jgi:predicted RNA methylase
MIDEEDVGKVDKGYVCINKTPRGYFMVEFVIGFKRYKLSRLIMNPPKGMVVDHRDHNTLNNCRSNLRICTPSQNQQNSVGRRYRKCKYKGMIQQGNCFQVRIQVEGKKINLGLFLTQEEAAIVYNIAAKKYFGEYAYLNDVPSPVVPSIFD